MGHGNRNFGAIVSVATDKTVALVERGWVPDSVVRAGIRRLLVQRLEELRITACNLLAETGGAAAEYTDQLNDSDEYTSLEWVRTDVIPVVLELCHDASFRVRRSAAQAHADRYRAEKKLFGVSIVYLFALFAGFILDAALKAATGLAWPVWF